MSKSLKTAAPKPPKAAIAGEAKPAKAGKAPSKPNAKEKRGKAPTPSKVAKNVKAGKPARSSKAPAPQAAALPYRYVDGRPEVLVLTTLTSRRWVIPKGWNEPGVTPWDLAAREAFEEAGLSGTVNPIPCGRFAYDKVLKPEMTVRCEVDVFPLRVEAQAETWPEKGRRETAWVSPSRAAMMVTDSSLAELLMRFGALNIDPDAEVRRYLGLD